MTTVRGAASARRCVLAASLMILTSCPHPTAPGEPHLAPDGAKCLAAEACASGACEGHGCGDGASRFAATGP